jgi:hypothetical protein
VADSECTVKSFRSEDPSSVRLNLSYIKGREQRGRFRHAAKGARWPVASQRAQHAVPLRNLGTARHGRAFSFRLRLAEPQRKSKEPAGRRRYERQRRDLRAAVVGCGMAGTACCAPTKRLADAALGRRRACRQRAERRLCQDDNVFKGRLR